MAASSDSLSSRPRAAWRARLSAFWRWWSAEIAAAARERLPAWRGSAGVPTVAFEGDQLVLVAAPGAQQAQGSVDLAGLDPVRARSALRSLLERSGETRARVRLRIGRGESLVRRIAMPLATEENLAQVLAFEMDRLTPFRSEEVYFDYRVLARDAAAGKIDVLLALARRPLVDSRVERLRELGANVQAVGVAQEAGSGAADFDLLPSEQRGERESGKERTAQRSLAAAVAILLAFALFIPVWRKRETVILLQPLVAQAHEQAEAANRLDTRLEREVGDYNFLLAKKYGSYPALAFIEELTRLLPDTTWLQQFELRSTGKGREIQVTGETTSSSKLIEILEQSKLLRNATPRGTVTRGSTPNSERFMIAAEAVPRPQPEPVPLLTPQSNAAGAPAAPSAVVAPKPPAAAPKANAAPAKPAAPHK